MAAEQILVFNDARDAKTKNTRNLFYKKPINRDNYKLNIDDEDCPQDIRRQRLLLHQKRSRDAAFNAGRAILDEVFSSDEEDSEEMEVEQKYNRTSLKFRQFTNKLMMSEWMLEVPEDYLEKWLLVPCPEGRRTLLVASKGKTKAYNRRGERLGKFNSALPGGNPREHANSCTILDCIWLKKDKKYYALDVLAWSNQPLVNCDAEFRLFWLKSKLNDTKDFQTRNGTFNAFPIFPLPSGPCNENTSGIIAESTSLEPIDGFLFFHREGQYTNGRTPLVAWLKPFMINEVLGIEIPESLDEKPDGYIDYQHYIESQKPRDKEITENYEMDVMDTEA